MPRLETSSNVNPNNGGHLNVGDDETPFFRISAELRNQIYELVYQDCSITFPTNGETLYPGLLLACKQTYHESLSVFYALSEFHSSSSERLLKWLRRMGREKRNLLQSVVVDHFCGTQLYTSLESMERDRKWRAGKILDRLDRLLADQGTDLRVGILRVRIERRVHNDETENTFYCFHEEDGMRTLRY